MANNTERRVVQLNREAERLHYAGETQEALRVAREALALASNLSKDHRFYAQCVNDLGLILRGAGDLDNAEDLILQAVEFRRRKFGTRHADFAESLANYGLVLKDRKRFGEAELHIRQAMDFFGPPPGRRILASSSAETISPQFSTSPEIRSRPKNCCGRQLTPEKRKNERHPRKLPMRIGRC